MLLNEMLELKKAIPERQAWACAGQSNMFQLMEDVMAKTATEKLLDDFHSVISETEELMKSVSNESGGKAQALRTKIEDNLKQAREYLHDFEGTVMDKSRIAARKTDAYVHENAWSTVGIAVGIGILIGLLMRERD